MHYLRELRELRLESNKIEVFNIEIKLMPKLECLGFDWFQFIVPQLKPLQYSNRS